MSNEGYALKRQIWAAAGSMLAGLLIQSAAAFFWAGKIEARMGNAESDVVRCEERIHAIETARVSRLPPAKPTTNN